MIFCAIILEVLGSRPYYQKVQSPLCCIISGFSFWKIKSQIHRTRLSHSPHSTQFQMISGSTNKLHTFFSSDTENSFSTLSLGVTSNSGFYSILAENIALYHCSCCPILLSQYNKLVWDRLFLYSHKLDGQDFCTIACILLAKFSYWESILGGIMCNYHWKSLSCVSHSVQRLFKTTW